MTTARPRRLVTACSTSWISVLLNTLRRMLEMYLRWPLLNLLTPSYLSYISTPRKVFGLETTLNTQRANKCEGITHPSWNCGLLDSDAVVYTNISDGTFVNLQGGRGGDCEFLRNKATSLHSGWPSFSYSAPREPLLPPLKVRVQNEWVTTKTNTTNSED
jgi:hypothetical protein